MTDRVLAILAEYDTELPLCEAFSRKLESLLVDVLRATGTSYLAVSSRVKTRASLESKIRDKPDRYWCLGDVTDIVGARVITILPSEVDRVGDVVRQQFAVDRSHSVDKRQLVEPDRFTYAALHYVVTLSPERLALPEYRQFAHCCAEIQILDLIAHAVNVPTHDPFYKSREPALPEDARDLATVRALAGLMSRELERLVQKRDAHLIRLGGARAHEAPSDRQALVAFVAGNSLVRQADHQILSACGHTELAPMPETLLGSIARAVGQIGALTINELEDLLRKHISALVAVVPGWHRCQPWVEICRGTSVDLLVDYLAANRMTKDEFVNYAQQALGVSDGEFVKYEEGVRDAWAALRAASGCTGPLLQPTK